MGNFSRHFRNKKQGNKMNDQYYSVTDDISFTPLTPEQERSLFERYYAGDLTARDEIVACHLKLVAKLSLQVSKGMLKENEAISAGNFGLMQALEAKKFDVNFGVRFGSYVRLYISGEVKKAVRAKLQNATEHSSIPEAEHYPHDMTMTGQQAGKDVEVYGVGLGRGSRHGTPTNACRTHRTWGFEEHIDGDKLVEDTDRAAQIAEALSKLSEVEAAAINGTYFEGRAFADIGRKLGLTREGIRKAHDRAVEKLKGLLSLFKPEVEATA